ncbi:hypothetical protein [Streptomyces resistomycificus]|nr:hypothetical protein [Streptomyces resistomycificus]
MLRWPPSEWRRGNRVHPALGRWAGDDGRAALPDLIAKALAAAFGDDIVD